MLNTAAPFPYPQGETRYLLLLVVPSGILFTTLALVVPMNEDAKGLLAGCGALMLLLTVIGLVGWFGESWENLTLWFWTLPGTVWLVPSMGPKVLLRMVQEAHRPELTASIAARSESRRAAQAAVTESARVMRYFLDAAAPAISRIDPRYALSHGPAGSLTLPTLNAVIGAGTGLSSTELRAVLDPPGQHPRNAALLLRLSAAGGTELIRGFSGGEGHPRGSGAAYAEMISTASLPWRLWHATRHRNTEIGHRASGAVAGVLDGLDLDDFTRITDAEFADAARLPAAFQRATLTALADARSAEYLGRSNPRNRSASGPN